jgi:hypothetical protein
MDMAIKKLKNNKATEMDFIQTYMTKNAGAKPFERLHCPTAKIWLMETIPEEWNVSIIRPIHKKKVM